MAYFEELVNRILFDLARSLDAVRSAVLRKALAYPVLRQSYLDRPTRLTILFFFTAVLYFIAVHYWPLMMSIVGPLTLGIPHFVAVVRYTPMIATPDELLPHEVQKRQRNILTGLIIFFGAVRYWVSFTHHPLGQALRNTLWPEVVGAICVFTVLLVNMRLYSTSRVKLRLLGTGLWFLTLFVIWKAPLIIMGVHTLIHNSLAFYYWYKLSATEKDRRACVTCGVVFHLVVALMLSQLIPPAGVYDPGAIFGLSIRELTGLLLFGLKDVAPGADLDWFGAGIVQLFVWGTNIHYFIWLKAIPDQFHKAKSAMSFRQELQMLWNDFGERYILFISLVFLAITAGYFFFGYWDVRMIYFALTAFHGYFELAAMGFLTIFRRA